jgi:hypothetical protein
MASVRSISSSKPSEHLSTRRVNHTSASPPPIAQRKVLIHRTTPTSRQKSSRMSLKKGSIGSNTLPTKLNSSNTIPSLHSLELATDQMACIQLQDLPSTRSRSRISDTANNLNSQVNHIDEQQNDTNESSSSSSTTSLKSSLSNYPFTLESFQTIRTVGTGKNLQK